MGSLRRPACLRAPWCERCRASSTAKYPMRARRIGSGQSLCVKTRMKVHLGATAPHGSPRLPVALENTAANHSHGVPIVNMFCLGTRPAHARQHFELCLFFALLVCVHCSVPTAQLQATAGDSPCAVHRQHERQSALRILSSTLRRDRIAARPSLIHGHQGGRS